MCKDWNVPVRVICVVGSWCFVFGSATAVMAASYFVSLLVPSVLVGGDCLFQVSAAGLLVCLVASFLSTDVFPVKEEKDVEWVSCEL